ncbi:ATP-binding cassette domain-containing protein [Streptomyces sp. NPDC085946]|uniref:ABC transporter ATP-binding protein n=1 Tax=Streptomyces sp. NPDC085946 TaxID=3365744 RepID=UPI0037D54E72
MIEAIGLTSTPRKELPPALDDVSFEARAGRVTALLGAPGAGKTTALRLMLELQQGRGVTYFRGRPLHRMAHPSREVGVLLGDVPGHPARTVRGHLRMLCAAAGVPVRRADEVLEAVGLVSLRDERLGTLSRGTDRRLGLACALLADPHTLVLDDPADGLSAREGHWLFDTLRAYASQGGTVLFTTADPKEAARAADHVVTLDRGRLVADQEAAEFARTRLRPRVAVRSPHAARLAALLAKEARTSQRSMEIVREDGNRLSVYGGTCAVVGETAFRHGIVVHQLADEVGDMGPGAGTTPPGSPPTAPGRVGATGTSGATTPQPSGATTPQPSGATTPQPSDANTVQPSDTATPQPSGTARVSADPLMEATGARPSGLERAAGPSGSSTAPERYPADASGRTPAEPRAHEDAQTSRDGTTSAPHPHATEPDAPTPAPTPSTPAEDPRSAPGQGADAASRHALQSAEADSSQALPALPPPISVRPAPGPLRPLRYEIRRALGVGTGFIVGAAVLAVSALTAVVLARIGHTPQPRLFAAWPRELPLPPAALGAALLGALSSGDEFRHPALAADRGTVPRRLGLLAAKLLVASVTALVLAVLTVGCDAEVLYLVYGRELTEVPADWLPLGASWAGLLVGSAWAGVLAGGVFRSTTGGLAAVVAVPLLVVPPVRAVLDGQSVRAAAGFPARLREVFLPWWPFGGERHLEGALRVIAQPQGGALALSLTVLLGAYLLTTLRSRAR